MPFPNRPEVREALLAYIYLNGGIECEVKAKDAYNALADYFELSETDKTISRNEKYGDSRREAAWNNHLQYVRRDLVDVGYIEKKASRGRWKLSANGMLAARKEAIAYPELNISTPYASDMESPNPARRIMTEIYRIIRDTPKAPRLKSLYKNACQICGSAIPVANGKTYSEAHHIKPLGKPHNGPDQESNIIIVCPTHHVQCDYWAIPLNLEALRLHPQHRIAQEFIDYHNEHHSKTEKGFRGTNN